MKNTTNKAFRLTLHMTALSVLLLLLAVFSSLLLFSLPSMKSLGWGFYTGRLWNPFTNEFGVLPFVFGTLATSFLALLMTVPSSLALSLLLGEYSREGGVASFLNSLIDLLAGIPSVIYGFWGMLVLIPLVRKVEEALRVPPFGVGIFTASLVLAIMILPYSASLGREVLKLVPQEQKEAAYALGATRYEVLRRVSIPYARSGIFAGFLLSLGRALGETMAVTMLIGNANILPGGIFSPGNTMASVIANEFSEATDPLYVASLIQVALVLFLLTTLINLLGKRLIRRGL
ncbi:MAG TPA: phosphate ABC transporter permease subunit PstC [Candidatus Aminicenantes bacterium]|nr:phosphate ABC transporter permease subunit PstC [Candidatus Aminicenantes bacterium]HPB54822.1 phosphate ABC transporter permease subunit PstC [Candidatus Aminicenantes bacterium]